MKIIDRSELTEEQLKTIDWQANLLEENYTHAMVSGTEGDYEIEELVTEIKLAEYITNPAYKLVRL